MKEILLAQKEFQTSKALSKIPQIYFYHIKLSFNQIT